MLLSPVEIQPGDDFDTVHIGREPVPVSAVGDHGRNGDVTAGNSAWRSRRSSIDIDDKIGFVGMMQQMVFDGRELFEDDDGDDGLVESTAALDVTGSPVTFTSSEAYSLVRSRQDNEWNVSSAFHVYFQVLVAPSSSWREGDRG